MKKFLATLVVILVLVCAFSVITYAAGEIYVNGEEYNGTLAEAWNANVATDSTIELKGDTTLEAATNEANSANTKLVVDLGGHTVTLKGGNNFLIGNGNVTFKNGTLYIENNASYAINLQMKQAEWVRKGTATLENVTITSPTANSDRRAICTGYNASYIANHTVNLVDCTIDATQIFRGKHGTSTPKVTVNIKGGTYTGAATNLDNNIENSATLNVYGGTFSDADVSKYVVDGLGLETVTNSDNTYTVCKPVIYANDVPFATLNDAFARLAGTTGKIELKDDVTLTSTIGYTNAASNIELDLGGNTLTVSGVNGFSLQKGTLTVKNGKIVNTNGNVYSFSFESASDPKWGRNAIVNVENVEIDATSSKRGINFNAGAQSHHTLNLTDTTIDVGKNETRMFLFQTPATEQHATVNIYSGNYVGGTNGLATASNVNVYGGTFTDGNLANRTAEGYVRVKNSDETYTVKESSIYVNGAPFGGTLEEAIAATKTGKIELKDDVTTTSQVELNDDAIDVELDLGTYTVTVSGNPLLNLKKGKVTVKNGKFVNANGNEFFTFVFDGNASYARNATLNLTDVEIDATATGRGIWVKGGANSHHTLNLTNTTINVGKGENQIRIFLFASPSNATVNINGGNYVGGVSGLGSGESINVYGGTFTDGNLANCTAEGYKRVTNSDGTYSVIEDTVVNVADELKVVYADGNDEYTYRFFAEIADYKLYAKAGFKVTAVVSGVEYEWNIELNEVYEAVNVNNTDYDAEGYILTGAIGEVPTDDVEFTVVPYAIDFEGNEIKL